MGFKKFIKSVANVATKLGDPADIFGVNAKINEGDNVIRGLQDGGRAAAAGKIFRRSDFEEGLKFGKEQIADGSLGRLGGNADVEAALNIRRQALGGLTGAEQQGQRDLATSRIQAQTEGARRRLAGAQARAGVTGAAGLAQQGQIIGQGIDATRQFEQNLFLQNSALLNYFFCRYRQ